MSGNTKKVMAILCLVGIAGCGSLVQTLPPGTAQRIVAAVLAALGALSSIFPVSVLRPDGSKSEGGQS